VHDERDAFALADADIVQLARWACAIEAHYGKPMDMEWAKDGRSGELFIVQARPETVSARREAGALRTWHVKHKGPTLVRGRSVGTAIAAGPACRLGSAAEGAKFPDNAVLVAEMTDPDWVPLDAIPATHTQVMLNLGNPAAALRWWRLPADGVGLARIEFIIGNLIRVHPLALARFEHLADRAARRQIEALTRGWNDKTAYFVDTLAQGIARIAASRYPAPVIVRMSDFKTNEYARLIGGAAFEPREPNPMLGWRGASRYYSDEYRDGFALECRAIRKARDEIGMNNVVVMIPFCRTPEEADRVLAEMERNGLVRGTGGLEVYVMCEIPSNVVLAREFAQRFDGFSIGSNDLTQLVLGVDRDSARLAELFNERHPAVTTMIREVIRVAHECGRKVGLCGQAPSDHPDFAQFLVDAGIDSMSVDPDSFVAVKEHVAAAERASG